MKYYLKKCGHQELGSVRDGKTQRGRYLLTSMNMDVLQMFPPLSAAQLNDSALLPIVPLYSGKKVYCNYVWHNDKFHESTAAHPRNEYRIYLNRSLEDDQLLFVEDDIIIIRSEDILEEETQTIYYLDYVRRQMGNLYDRLNAVIQSYPINGGYGIYEGVIPEFEEKVQRVAASGDYTVEIDDTVTKRITDRAGTSGINDVAALFTAESFRDFTMTGYGNLCAITGTVIRYNSFMNLEAAHIRPKSHGGLFLPNNGIALGRDLHWAFDKGFFTLDEDLRVMVHPRVSSEYLKSLNGQKIRVPSNPFFAPDMENVRYHRDKIYGLFLTTGKL